MTAADLTLFLDFDGVLHPLWEPAPYNDWTLERIHGPKAYAGPFFIHAPILVELLADFLPRIDIVISSTWGRKRDLVTLQGLLPEPVAAQVKDAVHHHLPPPEASKRGQGLTSRWAEINWYRQHVRPDMGDRWLAIDDDKGGWPPEAAIHLAHCNRPLGDPASQLAVEDAFLLLRFAFPTAEERTAERGMVPGAVGLDEDGNLVRRGEDGQLYPLDCNSAET